MELKIIVGLIACIIVLWFLKTWWEKKTHREIQLREQKLAEKVAGLKAQAHKIASSGPWVCKTMFKGHGCCQILLQYEDQIEELFFESEHPDYLFFSTPGSWNEVFFEETDIPNMAPLVATRWLRIKKP